MVLSPSGSLAGGHACITWGIWQIKSNSFAVRLQQGFPVRDFVVAPVSHGSLTSAEGTVLCLSLRGSSLLLLENSAVLGGRRIELTRGLSLIRLGHLPSCKPNRPVVSLFCLPFVLTLSPLPHPHYCFLFKVSIINYWHLFNPMPGMNV